METRTFKGVVMWDPPFAGDTRWEYEIVFSDDLCRICGGQMRPSSGNVKCFVDPARARDAVRGASLFYVRKPAVLMQPGRVLASMLAVTTLLHDCSMSRLRRLDSPMSLSLAQAWWAGQPSRPVPDSSHRCSPR